MNKKTITHEAKQTTSPTRQMTAKQNNAEGELQSNSARRANYN